MRNEPFVTKLERAIKGEALAVEPRRVVDQRAARCRKIVAEDESAVSADYRYVMVDNADAS